jgi:hypothetical protein
VTRPLLALAAAALALGACSSSPPVPLTADNPAVTAPAPAATYSTPAGGSVPWEDYEPGLKARIDTETDPAILQQLFDTADANNEATMARTGHNNADLMAYINNRLTVVDDAQ